MDNGRQGKNPERCLIENPKRTEERKKSTRFSDLETPKITNVNKKESTEIHHENVEEEQEEEEKA